MNTLIAGLFLMLGGSNADEAKEGTFEVIFTGVKQCIIDPCPQYQIISVDGKSAENSSADIYIGDKKLDFARSAMKNFKSFLVTGTYTQQDNYYQISNPKMHAKIKGRMYISEMPNLAPSKKAKPSK
ncbi:MAG: hypothetical protein J0L93_01700 [Deltaproteobacteria bacterium]|nr:hypothetical protein [Deltaproteobacteria bacterium]